MDYDAPPPKKGMSPWLIALLVGFAGICLCCGGMLAFGVIGGKNLFEQAATSYAEVTALATRVSTEFQEPSVMPGINTQTSTETGSQTTLSMTITNSRVPADPPEGRSAHALAIARFVNANANPNWRLTRVCIQFVDNGGAGTVTTTSQDERCFPVAELAGAAPVPAPDPAPTDAPTPEVAPEPEAPSPN